jgi:drug/metabolite transporter (DMT)-like permease
VSSGLASVMVATMPLWTVLFSRVFGERIHGRELAGIALGVVGVLVMNVGSELRASPLGAALALLAPMGWALGSITSKRMALPSGLVMRTATQMLCGGAGMLVVSVALGESIPTAPPARAVAAVVYLCVFGSIAGFSAFAYLLANVRPSLATTYAYVNPVIAVALGVAFGGEHLDAASTVGAAVVMGAVIVVARARVTARTSAKPEAIAPPAPIADV